MSDFNRFVSGGATSSHPLRRVTLAAGPLFSNQDVAALVVAAIMVLGPLAMGAFWSAHD